MATANTPRALWAAEYRAGRSANALYSRFRVRLAKAGEMPSFVLLSPNVDFTRLHGDHLKWGNPGIFHKSRMNHFADLPAGRLP